MRGVSLEEIAAATRISTRFLEALEHEQWSELPGGVFNRGFIRSVSKYLGLDEDDMVAEYELETQQGLLPAAQNNAHHNGRGINQARVITQVRSTTDWPRRSWIPAAVVLVVAVTLLLGGGWLIGGRVGPVILQRLHRQPTATAAQPSMDASASAAAPAQSVGGGIDSTSTTPAAIPSQASAKPPAATDPLGLKIEAAKPAHVRVFADGTNVFDGQVEVGNVQTFQARDNFQVSSSEASALLLVLNNQQLAPMGSPGQPATLVLTHKDLLSAGGGH